MIQTLKEIWGDLELRRMRPSARDDLHYMNIPARMKSWSITAVAVGLGLGVYFYGSYKINENPFSSKLVAGGVSPGMTFFYDDHAEDKKLLMDAKKAVNTKIEALKMEISAGKGYYSIEAFREDIKAKKLSNEDMVKIDNIVEKSAAMNLLKFYDLLHRIYSDKNDLIVLNNNEYKLLDVVASLKNGRYQNDYSARLEAPVNALMSKYSVSDKALMTDAIKAMVQHNKSTRNLIKDFSSIEVFKKDLRAAILSEQWQMQLYGVVGNEKREAFKKFDEDSKILVRKWRMGEIEENLFDKKRKAINKREKELKEKYKNVSTSYLTLEVNKGNVFNKIAEIREEIAAKKKAEYQAKSEAIAKRKHVLVAKQRELNNGLSIIKNLPYSTEDFSSHEDDLEKIIENMRGK